MFLITTLGSTTPEEKIANALHAGGCPLMYYKESRAEKELTRLVSHDRQKLYAVKPVGIGEPNPWAK